MKTISAILLASALLVSPVQAQKIDLSTMTCKQFVESGKENIALILMWLAGYYLEESDPPIVDFDQMGKDAEKLGKYCGENPTFGLITASEKVMGK